MTESRVGSSVFTAEACVCALSMSASLWSAATGGPQVEGAQRTVALVGGTLVNGTGAPPIRNAAVVIRGERIICAGQSSVCSVPEGAEKIDVRGRWLTPGLIDGHVHFSQTGWVDGRPDQVDVRAQHPYEQVEARNRNDPEWFFRAYLCSGVTAVYDLGGFAWSWSLRERAEHDPLAPHVSATGPLAATMSVPLTSVPAEAQFIALDSIEHAREAVRYLTANGADGMKLYFIPVAPEKVAVTHENIRAFADESRRVGMRFVTHAMDLESARFAVELGTSLLVHSVTDKLVDDEFVDAVKAHRTLYSPTLTVGSGYDELLRAIQTGVEPRIDDANGCAAPDLLRNIKSSPALREHVKEKSWYATAKVVDVDQERKREDEVMAANLRRMHSAGVPIVMGTDAGNPLTVPGSSVYGEMEAMQRAGMTPMETLVASTRNGAIAIGRDDIGTLEAGKIADILVLRADPTQDIRNMRQLETVVRAGRVHSQKSLRADAVPRTGQ